jgi:hypothetical protein
VSPEEFYAHALHGAGADGRLAPSRMTGWEVFPFEQEGLRVVPLGPRALPEPSRAGEGGLGCAACGHAQPSIWSDDHWRLSALGPARVPRRDHGLPRAGDGIWGLPSVSISGPPNWVT